jgi:hypothetical protein
MNHCINDFAMWSVADLERARGTTPLTPFAGNLPSIFNKTQDYIPKICEFFATPPPLS